MNAYRNLEVAIAALNKRGMEVDLTDETGVSIIQDDLKKHQDFLKELADLERRIQKFTEEQQKCAGVKNPIIYK